MRSSFFGLTVASQALAAQQQALEVSSHNVANANTPGYSRQRAELVASPPYSYPGRGASALAGQQGTGAEVARISRLRDAFTDHQIRGEQARLGDAQTRSETLQRIEVVFDEPTERGLNSALARFWNAWHDLASQPETYALRANLIEEARGLTGVLKHQYQQVKTTQTDLNHQVRLQVTAVNDLAHRIADLNAQVVPLQAIGHEPNDLRDQRDQLLTELAQIVRVTSREQPNGQIQVWIQGQPIVAGDQVTEVATGLDSAGMTTVRWADGDRFDPGGGKLAALLDLRDRDLPGRLAALDQLATGLIAGVNAVHRTGYGLDNSTGLDFFTGTGVADLAVAPSVSGTPSKIAAAGQPGAAGDGSRALQIARLSQSAIVNGATMADAYQSFIARLSVDTRQAESLRQQQAATVDHLERRQRALSGVSLDEEAAQAVQLLHAYQAAARMITTIDEMLDTLINRTGVTGR